MHAGWQHIGEQLVDPGSAELAGRQADAVDDDEVGSTPGGRSSQFGEGSWRPARAATLRVDRESRAAVDSQGVVVASPT
jgi:hypothetical protein